MQREIIRNDETVVANFLAEKSRIAPMEPPGKSPSTSTLQEINHKDQRAPDVDPTSDSMSC